METTVTLRTGAKMPVVGLGTWLSPPGAVKTAVIAALEAGVRHIDCAAAYGNEAEVGEAFKEVFARGVIKREDVFVTSKLWVTKAYPEDVAGALAQTLKDLGLAYLDLYLIHWPYRIKKGTPFPAPKEDCLGYTAAAFAETWAELEKAFDAGLCRAIGTSNAMARKLDALLKTARVLPAVTQVESHPYLPQTAELAFARTHGIVMTAYSPLGSPDRPARLIEEGDPAPMHDPAVLAIAAKHGKSAAQVLIRWQAQRGVVVIPKSTTPSRIVANFDVFDFALDEEDNAKLAALCPSGPGRRLLRGTAFTKLDEPWEALWDTDFLQH